MPSIRFEWDEAKNRSNLVKHGIGFAEAMDVFDDPLRLTKFDRIENGEVRWQTIGSIGMFRIILIAHMFFDDDDNEVVRLISARSVTRKERREYENENG
ncbi:MAG: BrnT family toxin [Pseudomonadota bacterium]